LTAKELLYKQLHLYNLKYDYILPFKHEHNKLLKDIKDMLERNVKLSKIKKYLKKELDKLYSIVRENIEVLEKDILMYYNVTKDDKKVLMLGLNIDDIIKNRINVHYNMLIQRYVQQDLQINNIKKNTNRRVLSIVNDYTKVLSNKSIEKLEEENNIKGWVYSAILDRRTSTLCISLNNKFYSYKRYKKRSNLPYIPNVNTHIGCRSMLITIFSEDNIKDFKNISFDEMLKTDKYEAEKLLGKKRYKLFIDNKLNSYDIFDYKNRRFYTIEELKARIT
jgi:hypothetical protein